MDKVIEQVSLYIHDVPAWPFVLLGVILLFTVGMDIMNRRRREEAVEYYNEVFHEELIGLYPIVTRWPNDLAAYMKPRLPILRDAFEMLRNFIPQDQLHEYNADWNKFYQFSRTGGSDRTRQENLSEEDAQNATTEQLDQHQQQQQAFQKMVEDLLVYTEQFTK